MNKQELVQHLRDLANGTVEPHYHDEGLCHELGRLLHLKENGISTKVWERTEVLIEKWANDRGLNTVYPIANYYGDRDKWNNPARLELTRWVADELEKWDES